MILDEATSSLDNETSRKIEKSILGIDNLTALVVTHKLSKELLKEYDEIIVLKDGRIKEVGEFNELMDRKKYFYNLMKITE